MIKNRNIGNVILYFITRPILRIANIIGISPNGVTLASLLSALAASMTAIYFKNLVLFILLNTVSVLLDHVDGPLARLNNQVRKYEFRTDHYSDLIKIVFFTCSLTLFYNDWLVDIVSRVFIIIFLLFTIINHDHNHIVSKIDSGVHKEQKPKSKLVIFLTEFEGAMYLIIIFSSINKYTLIAALGYNLILLIIYISKISVNLIRIQK
jgi:phosphatidylglycerophosphate synthase